MIFRNLFQSRRVRILFNRLYCRIRYCGCAISLGENCFVHPRARLKIVGGGKIILGDGCWIGDGAMIMTYGGTIHIEGHSSINPYCVVYGHGGLRIGSRVRIAAQTVIIPANHGFEDLEIPICDQPITRKGIRVEDNVWIGAGCRILDGVVISSGCVIAAGAVVTKSTVPNGVYAGVPARLLKLRV